MWVVGEKTKLMLYSTLVEIEVEVGVVYVGLGDFSFQFEFDSRIFIKDAH